MIRPMRAPLSSCLVPTFCLAARSGSASAAIIYGILCKFTPLEGKVFAPARIGRGFVPGVGMRLAKTVALVGMMGAGKTAVGTALARLLDVPLRDSDEEIVRAAKMTIPEIFARDGEPFFRAREAEVLARLVKGPPCILSTGGGAYLAEANRRVITENGVAVWLRADLELLWQRVRHKNTRPLLRTANPRETLRELYEARSPIYALADLVVDCDARLSIEEMALRVIEALKTRPDLWQEDVEA